MQQPNNLFYLNQQHNLQGYMQNYQQHIRNKSTVKKDLANRLIRFTKYNHKENDHHVSNRIVQNIHNKTIVRKSYQRPNQEEDQNYQDQPKCANHNDRHPEFIVKIDDEILHYCRKCATHIASQGFDVHNIQEQDHNDSRNRLSLKRVQNRIQSQKNSFNQQRNSTIPHPSASNLLINISPGRSRQHLTKQESFCNKKRSQLSELTKSLQMLKVDYREKSSQLQKISQSFQQQKQTLSKYYSSLISYIEEIRDGHIQAVEQESVTNIQICEIERGQIEQTLGEIDQMIYDVRSNIENIVNEVDQKNYVECYAFYRQKQGILSHRLQELGTEANPWPCTTQDQIEHKLQSFKQFIYDLHQVSNQTQQHQDSRDLSN